MEHNYWLNKWEANDIAFHQDVHHPLMIKYWDSFAVPEGSHVFVPLCGKSKDMQWLVERGYHVTGVELSEMAAQTFFHEQGRRPDKDNLGPFIRYHSGPVQILCGDFFALTSEIPGDVAGIFDRASLVALPPERRVKYIDRIRAMLKPGAKIMLITLTYEEGDVNPPPYKIDAGQVRELYGDWCDVVLIEESTTVVKGIACPEFVYELTAR